MDDPNKKKENLKGRVGLDEWCDMLDLSLLEVRHKLEKYLFGLKRLNF